MEAGTWPLDLVLLPTLSDAFSPFSAPFPSFPSSFSSPAPEAEPMEIHFPLSPLWLLPSFPFFPLSASAGLFLALKREDVRREDFVEPELERDEGLSHSPSPSSAATPSQLPVLFRSEEALVGEELRVDLVWEERRDLLGECEREESLEEVWPEIWRDLAGERWREERRE